MPSNSTYIGDLQEKITKVKKDEVAYLKNLLEKVCMFRLFFVI
jgi:hypothetical protein